MKLHVKFLLVLIIGVSIVCVGGANDVNDGYEAEDSIVNNNDNSKETFRNLVRPFRMEKLNLIWVKAQQRLTEPKLQSLYTQLKIQDKEELQYKQTKREEDTDGLAAAKLREKLITILKAYDLLDYSDHANNKYTRSEKYDKYSKDRDEYHVNKVSTFKDKKLNKLWDKAERAGFTADELLSLKKEFAHYEEKVDLYYKLLDDLDQKLRNRYENTVNQDELDFFNEVSPDSEVKDDHNEYLYNANKLREKHRELKDTYDNLERKAAQGRNRREFVDPKVINLWNIALESNFTASEIAALKEELFHFESRLLKLSHLYAEQAIGSAKSKAKKDKKANEKMDHVEKNIKKQARKVEKLQESIEKQIYRHSEL